MRFSDFQKVYQDRINIGKDETGDLVTGSYSILVRWMNSFSQLLNVQGSMMLGRKKKTRSTNVGPEPSAFEFVLTIDKFKVIVNHRYWSDRSRIN